MCFPSEDEEHNSYYGSYKPKYIAAMVFLDNENDMFNRAFDSYYVCNLILVKLTTFG